MMDFTKTCWYCGRNEMEPFDGYSCCANCGATWNEVSKVSERAPSTAQVEAVEVYDLSGRKVIGVGKRIKKRKVTDATNI